MRASMPDAGAPLRAQTQLQRHAHECMHTDTLEDSIMRKDSIIRKDRVRR